MYDGLGEISRIPQAFQEIESACVRAQAIARREFTFLNNTISFEGEIGWNDSSQSHLWRFNLHYFEYVGDLLIWSARGARTESYRVFRDLVKSWIEANNLVEGDAWHPYTISIRLPQWLAAAAQFKPELAEDPEFTSLLFSSIRSQGKILRSELEFDVRTNHLIANLRALLWLGICFEDKEPRRWFSTALSLLKKELEDQVLPDGGHVERNPGYHLVVLQHLLDVGLLLRRNRRESLPWLESAIQRMAKFAIAILQPDMAVPLLKDTALNTARPAEDVVAACALYLDQPTLAHGLHPRLWPFLLFGTEGTSAENASQKELEGGDKPQAIPFLDSGFYVLSDKARNDYLIFDAGKIGPDYQPGHGHADMLSFELTFGGKRVIVDSGAFAYARGTWRDYFRSTRAHNTVEVEGYNQSEVWDSFRVARRASQAPVFFEANENHVLIQGSCDGYKRLPSRACHRRALVWVPNKFTIIVDRVTGLGKPSLHSYLHFHPGLEPVTHARHTWSVKGTSGPLWVMTFGIQREHIVAGAEQPPAQGWYSERLGQISENPVMVMTVDPVLPASFGYVIARELPQNLRFEPVADGIRLVVSYRDGISTFSWNEGKHPVFF
jgi:hypothetical protein